MSWNARWTMGFASLHGRRYRVEICEDGWDGAAEVLEGGQSPFETKEDDDGDVFTPVRKQIAQLRIVTTDRTLLGRLMPTNNVERLVRLKEGSMTRWMGFMQCQGYDQPWGEGRRQIMLSVSGLAASLDNVQMEVERFGQTLAVHEIVTDALETLFGGSVQAAEEMGGTGGVCVVDTMEDERWLRLCLSGRAFFEQEDNMTEGTRYTERKSLSYLKILETVMQTFGLCMREDGNRLYMADLMGRVSTDGELRVNYYQWAAWAGGSLTATTFTTQAVPLSAALGEAMGAEAMEGYVPGRKQVRVTFELDAGDEVVLEQPLTDEDASTVYELPVNSIDGGGTLYIQIHQPRTGNNEEYFYSIYNSAGTRTGSSDSATFVNAVQTGISDNSFSSVLNGKTGCTPIRWRYMTGGVGSASMSNGMLFSLQHETVSSQLMDNLQRNYVLKSIINYTYSNGYIYIQFNMMAMMTVSGSIRFSRSRNSGISLAVTFGGKSWDGTSWKDIATDGIQTFTAEVEDGRLKGTAPQDAGEHTEDGVYIPLDGTMTSGEIVLYLMDYASVPQFTILFNNCSQYIISDIVLEHVHGIVSGVSTRQSNNYIRNLADRGFSKSRVITTKAGTMNNNVYASNLLLDENGAGGGFVEQVRYTEHSESLLVRPEIHLLEMMVLNFGQTRRYMLYTCDFLPDGAVAPSTLLSSMYGRLYVYDGHYYAVIDSRHRWRDDEQDVKMIETI